MKRHLATFVLLAALAASGANQFVQLPNLPSRGTVTWSPSWGDYDRDGDLDLIVANGGGSEPLDLYRNRGDGTFEHMTGPETGPLVSDRRAWASAYWTDVDHDGLLDVVATVWGSELGYPALYHNRGDGSFGRVDAGDFSGTPSRMGMDSPADFTGDGWVDLVCATDTQNLALKFFVNRGDLTFARQTGSPWTTETLAANLDFWADIDLDGDLDIFAANALDTVLHRDRLLLNDGHGHFTVVTNIPLVQTSRSTWHGAFGDYDQDGDFDCILIKNGPPQLFRNDAGTFVPADIGLPTTAGGATWVDFDNDGLVDLFLERGQGSATTNSLLRNLGDGTYAQVIDLLTTNRVQRQGSAWADLDNDGDLDLAEVSPRGGSRLFLNLGNTNHWLKLNLRGTASPTDARGALVRVRATIGGKPVLQMQHVGGGNVAPGEPRPHFGLGDATQADEVSIRWPSGNVQILSNVAADRILDVTEPTGITPARPVATINGSARLTGPAGAASQQWLFEGQPLEGETHRLLTLTNLQPAQAGRYTVVAQTDSGPVTHSVLLRVDERFVKILEGEVVTERLGSVFASWFDYDGDGRLDLHVANSASSPHDSLFRNLGDAAFARVTENPVVTRTPGAVAAAIGDVDNDGRPDLFIPRIDRGDLCRNEGGGAFTLVSSEPLTAPRSGSVTGSLSDYNGDGLLDLFVAYGTGTGGQPSHDALFRGTGNGSFAEVGTNEVGELVRDGLVTRSGVWFDYDGDGAQDLLVIHQGTLPRLFHNNRDGTFTRTLAGSLPAAGGDGGAAVGDYDNDGWLDLFLTQVSAGRTTLHRNLGNGTFTNVTAAAGIALPGGSWPLGTWVDFDNDGNLDLFLTTYETNALYRNHGDGTFGMVDVGNLRTDGENTSAGAWGDIDNNGFPDLLLVCGDAVPHLNHLYRNTGNSNHWLKVKLRGTASNGGGIGAKVRVRATLGGKIVWQLREVSGNSAWNGAQQLIPSFGLGSATRATAVRIEWPSGTLQEFGSVTADQVLEVVEPTPWRLTARPTAEGIRLEVRGPANDLARLEWSGNLKSWYFQAEVTTDATGAAVVEIQPNTGGGARFYRIRKL